MHDARHFPIFLKLDGRRCLVIGNGSEAAHRASTLLEARAEVRLIAPEPDASLRTWLRQQASPLLSVAERPYEASDLDGVWLALLTERNAELAERVARDTEARQIFFCAVDQPAYGSFAHGARVSAGALTLAIGTAGRAPALARRLREIFQELFDRANLAEFVAKLAELREKTPSAERHRVLGEAVKSLRLEGRLRWDERE